MEKLQFLNVPSEENPFLIVCKSHGLPSAPVHAGDKENALSLSLEAFPELKNVHGRKEIECGLLHRLDTVTEGLLLIAATDAAYESLTKSQNDGLFIKAYRASVKMNPYNAEGLGGFDETPLIDGIRAGNELVVNSCFRFYGEGRSEVRPVNADSKNKFALKKIGSRKIYTTNIKVQNVFKDRAEVECTISQGFRHQVRSHLAWIGLPIINDPLYNLEYKRNNSEPGTIRFKATRLCFPHPVTGERTVFELKDEF